MKIAVIGGGNMGKAIGLGAINSGFIEPHLIRFSDPSEDVHKYIGGYNPNIELFTDSREAIKGVDLIIVAVKPWLLETVLTEISDVIDRENQNLVSIVAGANFSDISTYLGGDLGQMSLYRVIPNTAVILGKGTSFIARYNSTASQDEFIFNLFSSMGDAFMVEEPQMWTYTALSSCGIAYAYKYIDAAIQGGVKLGIEQEEARAILIQTIKGALAMLENNNSMPQTEIDKVTTPGGITLRGLAEMEKNGFTDAVIKGLLASK